MLLQQRAFRIDQLNRLDSPTATKSDPARDEIGATLREAARRVLTLIDAALRRIEEGSYGHCQRCGDLMSLHRLTALPMSTLCGRCQLTLGIVGPDRARGPEHSRTAHRDI
ncbi:TraR/DksA family transcriptional regulator [Nocardioides bizhenqiangii]|uniref:TraR/DksA family transcriptional regulator n=1 Tax=Nocardioides bizhenqiangii TaxID=3095076 RepID=A0ABZ0ZSF0_9ACTN|nr:TraR/DksA family transcriptional regulator [Nocardioides sp. HM61]WQQ27132.1 TraR/DksA family transcriptional regulator [Nocardioides sp. HM61]